MNAFQIIVILYLLISSVQCLVHTVPCEYGEQPSNHALRMELSKYGDPTYLPRDAAPLLSLDPNRTPQCHPPLEDGSTPSTKACPSKPLLDEAQDRFPAQVQLQCCTRTICNHVPSRHCLINHTHCQQLYKLQVVLRWRRRCRQVKIGSTGSVKLVKHYEAIEEEVANGCTCSVIDFVRTPPIKV